MEYNNELLVENLILIMRFKILIDNIILFINQSIKNLTYFQKVPILFITYAIIYIFRYNKVNHFKLIIAFTNKNFLKCFELFQTVHQK